MKNLLHFLAILFIFTTSRAQTGVELPTRRTLNSKTWHNAATGQFTTRISLGDVHYLDKNGNLQQIETRIKIVDGGYGVKQSHYRARFSRASGSETFDVDYQLPWPRGRRVPRKDGKQRPNLKLKWKIAGFGLFDKSNNNYQQTQAAQNVNATVSGNSVIYRDIFSGIDARFDCKNNKLKEQLVLSQQALNNLPDPASRGMAPENAYIMFAAQFALEPEQIDVYATDAAGSRARVKNGAAFSFEGEGRIDFTDDDNALYCFMPKNYALATGDSLGARQPVLRFLYSSGGRNYLLAGVPWTWLEAAPAGQVIIDPTISVGGGEDVWMEDTSNQNGQAAGLLAGSTGGAYPKKRTLIKFDLSGAGIPSYATVQQASLRLTYYARVNAGGPWIDRRINANQVLVDWLAAEATKDIRKTGVAWSLPYGAINGTDVKATAESSVLFTAATPMPSFQSWDLTALAQQWVNGTAANYGILLWANDETLPAYDLRFRSFEDGAPSAPVLDVVWTQQQRSVYYLKDHLGSVRASVDDNGQLLSRDDYDPWGLQLAGRSMTVQPNLPNKFTGKEWDDDFGLNVYHIGARRYDPEIGRWWSVDPLTQQFPGVSPYSYPFNNPLRFTDPTGMAGDDEVDGREGISYRAQYKDAGTVLNMLWNTISGEVKTGTNKTTEAVTQTVKETGESTLKATDAVLSHRLTSPFLTGVGIATGQLELFYLSDLVSSYQSVKITNQALKGRASGIDAALQVTGTLIGMLPGANFAQTARIAATGEVIQGLQYLPTQRSRGVGPGPGDSYFTGRSRDPIVNSFNRSAGNLRLSDYQKASIILKSGI